MAQVKTAAQMFPLVESWQKSGLTQKEFSQKHQISDQVFYYWVARYRKAGSAGKIPKSIHQPPLATPTAEAQAAFIRLSPSTAPVTPVAVPVGSTNPETAVELPSGVVLRFSGLVPVAYLRELVGLSKPGCSCSA